MTAPQQPPQPSPVPIDAVVDLAALALQFGRVNRITHHCLSAIRELREARQNGAKP